MLGMLRQHEPMSKPKPNTKHVFLHVSERITFICTTNEYTNLIWINYETPGLLSSQARIETIFTEITSELQKKHFSYATNKYKILSK